eukprot:1528053-Amphidinium_carterae.1
MFALWVTSGKGSSSGMTMHHFRLPIAIAVLNGDRSLVGCCLSCGGPSIQASGPMAVQTPTCP